MKPVVTWFGTQHLPRGGAVLVSNHPTEQDAALLAGAIPGPVLVIRQIGDRVGRSWGVRAMDFDRPGAEADLIVLALKRGLKVLTFPEQEPAPTLRRFHEYPAELAERARVPLVPVGIRGAYAAGNDAGIRIRFGEPIPAGTPSVTTAAAHDAVVDLLAEDSTSWWQVQRLRARGEDPSEAVESGATWRRVWAQTAPPRLGSTPPPRQIWR